LQYGLPVPGTREVTLSQIADAERLGADRRRPAPPARGAPPARPVPHPRPAGPTPRRRPLAALLVPPLLAFAVGIGLLWLAADGIGVSLLREGAWGKWDSGQYLSITTRGYFLQTCTPRGVPP